MEIAGRNAELPEIRRRTRALGGLVVLVFLALAARLFYLQIVEGETYYRVTSDSIIRTVNLPAVRGQIRDRKGRVLATTRPSYSIVVNPAQTTREAFTTVRRLLARDGDVVLDWDQLQQQVRDRARKAAAAAGGSAANVANVANVDRSVILAEDVPHEIMAAIETNPDLPGIRVAATPRRHYPFGALAGHMLGYLNEISADELKRLQDGGYKPADVVGRTGLERQWEPYLRGQKGFEKMVVDRRGLRRADIDASELVEGPVRQAPVPGQNLVLTLDVDLQKIAERALRPHRAAAAVIVEVDTGRVLAMTSKPGFDPNEMSGRLTADVAGRLFADPRRPFRDRATSETYNPGSTFKLISSIAALEDKILGPDERTKCNGFVVVGRRRFRCTKSHGLVGLPSAIVQSCNVFFYELGMRPGMMNRLARYANDLGLGSPTGLGLNGEQAGFVPTEEWHQEQSQKDPREGFVIGHALNTAIGEGSTRVTVMQMALLYATVATGGKLWLPQMVDRIEASDGQVIEEFPPRVRRHISLPPETLALLRRALIGVVNDPKGTAFKARSRKYVVAGKTGTAQAGRLVGPNGEPAPYGDRLDHAWFAGFAPADKPRIAFAIIVEHGGHGGDVAAPVATEIIDSYFDQLAAQAAAPAPPPARPEDRRP